MGLKRFVHGCLSVRAELNMAAHVSALGRELIHNVADKLNLAVILHAEEVAGTLAVIPVTDHRSDVALGDREHVRIISLAGQISQAHHCLVGVAHCHTVTGEVNRPHTEKTLAIRKDCTRDNLVKADVWAHVGVGPGCIKDRISECGLAVARALNEEGQANAALEAGCHLRDDVTDVMVEASDGINLGVVEHIGNVSAGALVKLLHGGTIVGKDVHRADPDVRRARVGECGLGSRLGSFVGMHRGNVTVRRRLRLGRHSGRRRHAGANPRGLADKVIQCEAIEQVEAVNLLQTVVDRGLDKVAVALPGLGQHATDGRKYLFIAQENPDATLDVVKVALKSVALADAGHGRGALLG